MKMLLFSKNIHHKNVFWMALRCLQDSIKIQIPYVALQCEMPVQSQKTDYSVKGIHTQGHEIFTVLAYISTIYRLCLVIVRKDS